MHDKHALEIPLVLTCYRVIDFRIGMWNDQDGD